jgi:radical SAM protein with 4Fe4S-binding SPASM domain
MSFEVAQQAINEYMEADNGFSNLEVDFFGGEPMLAFDLIRDLVDWFHTRQWSKGHVFLISTNATILTEEIKNWLIKNQNCVYVAVSLDGNKTAHDLNRSNSYDRVMQNLPFFLELSPKQPVKMTISAETIPHIAESIIEFEKKGIPFTANIVYEDIWGSPEQKAGLLAIYGQQLERLVEFYVEHEDLFPARMIDLPLEVMANESLPRKEEGEWVRYCGAGHEMVCIEVDGTRSPCHRFSPWVTGKAVPDEPVNRQRAWLPSKCAECQLLLFCPICAGYNWQLSGDSGIRTTYHCDAFKLEVQASAKLHALRLLKRKPEEILNLSPDEAYKTKFLIDVLLDMVENGI